MQAKGLIWDPECIFHTVKQRTEEWHALRRRYVTASEMACVVGGAKYPPRTWRQLWDLKKGVTPSGFENEAMRRGTEAEGRIVELVNQWLGEDGADAVANRGNILASLDWINPDGTVICEFKTPVHGFSTPWVEEITSTGKIPAHYWMQVQAQLYVTGAKVCWFVVYDHEKDDIAYTGVEPDEQAIEGIVRLSDEFYEYLLNDKYPPAQPGDVKTKDDDYTIGLVETLQKAKEDVAVQLACIKTMETKLKDIAMKEGTFECEGLRVSKISRAGAIDWPAVQKDQQLSDELVNRFRKKPTTYCKITEVKRENS